MIRVATAQFETGKDKDRVLNDILSLIDEAAAGGARLVHFQECCNYPTSYADREQAWEEAITVPGPMFDAIAERARRHGIFVGFNAAVRGEFPTAYMVNHLIGPDGRHIGSNKKQVLMWIERDYFEPSDEENRVFDTEIGRIGLLSCMDGLVPETTRTLACRGADIVLNSLCSNGIDEAHLHIPARAAENGIFMISANRIGDMVKGQDLQDLIEAAGMSREAVMGAGESQIVGPDGEPLARASRDGFGLVFADIDLAAVERDERLSRRRPECYGLVAEPGETLAALVAGRPEAGSVAISCLVPEGSTFEAVLASACQRIRACEPGLAVLPELFAWRPEDLPDRSTLQAQVDQCIRALSVAAAEAGTHVVAGIVEMAEEGLANRAVLIGPEGVIGTYRQVHRDPGLGWDRLGDDFTVFDLPFGRLAMLLGEDLMFPEAARVLARKGVDLIACPARWRTSWQAALMLRERSAENHITIAASARADSPVPQPSIIVTTPPEYRFPATLEVNNPDRFMASALGESLCVTVDLAPNRDKRLMGATDLIMDARPELYGVLVDPSTEDA